jgi:predicted lipid-binding transport protein (Tim44 family)
MDIIILAMIAAVAVFKLYQVLGNKKYNPGQASYPAGKPTLSAIGKNIPAPKQVGPVVKEYNQEEEALFEQKYGKEIWGTVKKIQKLDPVFEPDAFISGAKNAFELIIKSYSKRDKEALTQLVSKEVLENLTTEIQKQDAQGERHETTLIAIKTADIVEANLDKKNAKIQVKFVTDQVHLVKDNKGAVTQGSPSQVDRMIEIWTFEKLLATPNQNWALAKVALGT